MTGYGFARFTSDSLDMDVTIRSVNGRFLDIRLHLPKEYLSIESEIKSKITKFFTRGTVDIYVNRRSLEQSEIKVASEIGQKWAKAYRDLAKTLKIAPKLSIEHIATLPNVMVIETISEISTSEKKTFYQVCDQAVKQCLKERIREGQALKKGISEMLVSFKENVAQIEAIRSEANGALEARLKKRLFEKANETFGGLDLDPIRFAQEVVYQIDRSDINEEVQRLNEHIQHIVNLIESKECHGKKLDFYCQELLRETNTIGAKSQIAELTRLVVLAKTTIEKIKEQVQNIE